MGTQFRYAARDRYGDASTEWLPAASRSLLLRAVRGGFSGIDNDASTFIVNKTQM
jgi:hypothetical protein